MWGASGGPGTIYKLDPRAGYMPRPFANITLNGRPNTGAALGNIAYDRWNQQLFVSDMETGMIHRIRSSDGADLGFYDHGVQGRAQFPRCERPRQQGSLPPIPFDPTSQARIANCPIGTVPAVSGVLEHRGERAAGVGAWRRPRLGERRNPALLFGRQQPGSRRGARPGTACRTTRSAIRSGRSGSVRTETSTRRASGANS